MKRSTLHRGLAIAALSLPSAHAQSALDYWAGSYSPETNTITSSPNSFRYGYIGFDPAASNSQLTLSNGGALSLSHDMNVGYFSSGNRLVIASGAALQSTNGYVGMGGSGECENNRALVTGANSTWRNRTKLTIGQSGNAGELVVSQGGTIHNGTNFLFDELVVGFGPAAVNGSGNTVRVMDAGSLLHSAGPLIVGDYGDDNGLVISNGGQVDVGYYTSLGRYEWSSGNRYEVTGAGSTSTHVGTFNIGFGGSGNEVVISDGGSIDGSLIDIGVRTMASDNHLLVTGAGSSWTYNSDLHVGSSGNNNGVIISNGGSMTGGNIRIGSYVGSGHHVLVTGAGSVLTSAGSIVIGGAGSGNGLTIAGAGTVTAASMTLNTPGGGVTSVNIGTPGGSDSAGTLNVPTLSFGSGNGILNFNQANTVSLATAISGGGRVSQNGSGTSSLSGTNSYSGGTTIQAGVLVCASGGAVGGGPVTVTSGAQLKFSDFSSGTFANDFTLGGAGPAAGGAVFFNRNFGSISLTGGVALSGDTLLRSYAVSSTLTFGQPVTGTGDLTLAAGGAATNHSHYWVLGGTKPCSYDGDTLLRCYDGAANAVLKLNGGSLPASTILTLEDRSADATRSVVAVFDLNGGSQTLAGLARINGGGRGCFITNTNAAAAAVLTLSNPADCSFSGVIGRNTSSATTGVAAGNDNLVFSKSGPGSLTLTGNNTYTGQTKVSSGTLILGGNQVLSTDTPVSMGDSTLDSGTFTNTLGALEVKGNATIRLGTGAALAFADSKPLDWTGAALQLTGSFVPGASLRFGTHAGSLSPSQLNRISAAGYGSFELDANGYLIAAADVLFADWIAGNFTNGVVASGQRQLLDDPDRDGISNLLEYAIAGQDPTVPAPLPGLTGNTLSFSKRSGAVSLTYAILESTDLGSGWTEVSGAPYVNDLHVISYTEAPGTRARNFFRLRITGE